MTSLWSFADVLDATASGEGRHILLGNGFSAGASTAMTAEGLVTTMRNTPGFEGVRHLFEREQTYNFELVMGNIVHRAKATAQWREVQDDLNALRAFFTRTIARSQAQGVDGNDGDLMGRAGAFLSQFDSIFSLNFDQHAYRALLQAKGAGLCEFTDGFNPSQIPGSTEMVYGGFWSNRKRLHHPHGTLFIREPIGGLAEKLTVRSTKFLPPDHRKTLFPGESTKLSGICLLGIDRIKPLIVAAGTSQEKMERICASPFLRDALTALGRIRGDIVTYGWSMSEPDEHLIDAIAKNSDIRNVYVGIHGDCQTNENQEVIRKATLMIFQRVEGSAPQGIKFFSTNSAGVWGDPDLRFVGQSTVWQPKG